MKGRSEESINIELRHQHTQIEVIRREMAQLNDKRKEIHNRIKDIQGIETNEMEYKELVQLKKEHKRLEADIQMLTNSIELLKKNEIKFLKNIRELHRRAEEIEKQKKINEERKREKEMVKQKIESMSRTKGNFGIEEKKKSIKRMQIHKKILEEERKRKAEQLKLEKEKNERTYLKNKERLLQQNIIKKNSVTRIESFGLLRKDQYRLEKKERVLQRLRSEKSKEKFIIKRCQQKVSDLIRHQEMRIDNLKSNQKMEDEAYDKLKKAMDIKDDDEEEEENSQSLKENKFEEEASRNKDERLHSAGTLSAEHNLSVE